MDLRHLLRCLIIAPPDVPRPGVGWLREARVGVRARGWGGEGLALFSPGQRE